MSTHNIGFYGEINKIIAQLSSNTHLISSSGVKLTATSRSCGFFEIVRYFREGV